MPSHGPLHDYLEDQLVTHADRDSLDESEPPLAFDEMSQEELERLYCEWTGLPLPEETSLRIERISDWQRLLEEER
jgi:hypothetical protein